MSVHILKIIYIEIGLTVDKFQSCDIVMAFFLHLWIQLLNVAPDFRFVFGNGSDISGHQNRPSIFRYMVKLSKYEI